jgi:acyl-CoA thioesterase-1
MMRKSLAALALTLAAPAALAEPVTIAALGDSLTHGYGLPPEDGFVAQLDAWLAAQGAEVTLINAGVSGDTTAGGAARIGWTLTPEVDGLIVALGANDFLRGLDPGAARANLDTILATATEAGVAVLLVGFEAPGNYGPDYKTAFDAIYPDLAQTHDTLYAPDFFAGLTAEGSGPADLADYFQPDGLHPNAEGVARIVAGLGPFVLDLQAQAAQAD